MVYICAWQAAPLQPDAWISSMIAAAARHGQSAAAVFFGDQGGEKAGLGQSGDEFFRIGAFAVELPPVFAGEIRAQRAHGIADRCEVGGFGHGVTSARPLLMATTSRSTTRARKLTSVAVAPHLGADGLAGKDRSGKAAGERCRAAPDRSRTWF